MNLETSATESLKRTSTPAQSKSEVHRACDELGSSIDQASIGQIVAKHEKLILHYYQDVQEHAKKSFGAATRVAKIGFWVLIGTLAYALIFDGLSRFKIVPVTNDSSFTVAGIGIVSGALIEFIAGISFWLYSRVSNQFSAFHICLERTHRYLLAYKITEQISGNKDETVRDLVCIMAKAPMITREDVDAIESRRSIRKSTNGSGAAAEVKKQR